MSRRPLRRIDPALDLTQHLLSIEQLPKPWNAPALFPQETLLEIEVGSGKGLFLAQAAAATPGHNYLGIEMSAKYARFCAARLAKHALQNARIVCGDARRVLAEYLPDGSATAVHIYFPDPWWKKRHKKRRVLNEQFVRDVERILQPAGSLHFWTDVEEYFQTTLELIRSATRLSGPCDIAERAPQHDLDYQTHFERRTRLHGEAVYRAEFRKVPA